MYLCDACNKMQDASRCAVRGGTSTRLVRFFFFFFLFVSFFMLFIDLPRRYFSFSREHRTDFTRFRAS